MSNFIHNSKYDHVKWWDYYKRAIATPQNRTHRRINTVKEQQIGITIDPKHGPE